MATEREFIVNKKFLIVFVSIQVLFLILTAYILLSPKTVTVQVQKIDNSFDITQPLTIRPPEL